MQANIADPWPIRKQGCICKRATGVQRSKGHLFMESKVFLFWEFNYLIDSGVNKRVIGSEKAGANLFLPGVPQ